MTLATKAGSLWEVIRGDGPLVGLAVHAGHQIRGELRTHLAIDEETRLREEDPYTNAFIAACGTRVLTHRSRFEIDLNRPAEEAICVQPEDCWNLRVWRQRDGLSHEMIEHSLTEYAAFYDMLERELDVVARREGRFVLFDMHSYNHRRDGPEAPPANAAANPDINIGTGSMDRAYWAPVVDRFIAELRGFDFLGRRLDIRENVNFRGRQLAAFVHRRFPRIGCALAIEVKKFFMDEWTGRPDPRQVEALTAAFKLAGEGVEEELGRFE